MEIDRRKFLVGTMVTGLSLTLTGCGFSDKMTLEEIMALLLGNSSTSDEDSDEDTSGIVKLAITYPAGRSPNVFTSGWVFGARCTIGDKDVSDTVKWSGTGSFNPDTGPMSRPIFNSEGPNTITLSVTVGTKTYNKTVTVNAMSPDLYAGVGSLAICPADSHGCPACPHSTVGPIITGSPNVFVNGKRAARVGDKGTHAACCGPNSFEIIGGDERILINGRRAVMIGDATSHCGGVGKIIGGG